MSYILDALKKAQAERQLGETPTIHAPVLDAAAVRTGAPVLRKPLLAVIGGMAAVIAALAVVVWRQAGTPEPVAAPAVVAPPPVAVAPTPRPRVTQPAPAPVHEEKPATPAPAEKPAAPQPVAKADDKPAEEPVQALRDLPEPIQRAIPPIAMSGYMYSANPADRLILIDKVLRHEGEEVAPGLVLVALEPKGAVFTFRGYRYRVPY